MQQIKIFKSLENESDKLEQAVNAWLKTSRVKVVQVFGNIAPQTMLAGGGDAGRLVGAETTASRRFGSSDILLTVLYESA